MLLEPSVGTTLSSNANPNKNEQGMHRGILPYDNNGYKHEVNEISKSKVNVFSRP